MSNTNDRLLEVVTMPCPICGLVHGVENIFAQELYL